VNQINYNGKLYPGGSPLFSINRAVNYGDGLFETIRIHEGEILFFEDHIDRMLRAMQALKLDDPEQFSGFFFHKQIVVLAHLEKVGANARVRIGIFRSGEGLYEPTQNTPAYFMEVLPMENRFRWYERQVEAGVFTDIQRNFSTLSFFKSMNALPSVMAAVYKKGKSLDDCFLLNASGKIVDAISSNIFWIEKGRVFSPPVSDGGVEGVMRKNLIRILLENKFPFEEKSVTPDELKSADEVFLTNVGWGIKPVTKFETASYSTAVAKENFLLLEKEFK